MGAYLLARLRETSTWRGLLILVAGLLGYNLTDVDALQVIAAGNILAGIVGAALPDRTRPTPEETAAQALAAIQADPDIRDAVREWIQGRKDRV